MNYYGELCIQMSSLRYKNSIFYTFSTVKLFTDIHDFGKFFCQSFTLKCTSIYKQMFVCEI